MAHFRGKIFFSAKFCHIETRYTKFQGNPTKNSHFIDFQSFTGTLKLDNYPYIKGQYIKIIEISLKYQKINISWSNKKQSHRFVYGYLCMTK